MVIILFVFVRMMHIDICMVVVGMNNIRKNYKKELVSFGMSRIKS